MNYPLASTTWDEREYEALQRVIESGIFTMGKKVAEFEQEFARFVGSNHAVMVNSGSSANLLMVAALRYRSNAPMLPGTEVIVPAVSWSTTYYPLYQYGLKLRFVDVDAETLNYDLEQLEEAITPATKVIMVVNLLGNPNDFAAINKIVEGRDILLLEDNCESLGALFDGKQAGTFGLMGSYSSFFSHHISTMEGGLITTDDEELYHILLCLRAHGWTRNLPKENHVAPMSDNPFEESFRFILPGYNVRPLEMSGAIGLEQLKKLPDMVLERRRNAEKFRDLMEKYPFLRIQREIGQSSWFGFAFTVKSDMGYDRGQIIAAMNKSGIEVRPIVAGNFTKNQTMKWFDYSIHGELKNANDLDQNGFFIGNHHFSLSDEFEVLDRVLTAVVNGQI